MGETSIVEYFSAHEKYKCGYCKSEDTCYSFSLWGHVLTPLDYQNLIDRGWRRSGKYCYKPTMHLTCCPQYTIRCEALRFKLSRSQKKVLKKVRHFLANGQHDKRNYQPSENCEQIMDICDFPESMEIQNLKDLKEISDISNTNTKSSDVEFSSISLKQSEDKSPVSPSAHPSHSSRAEDSTNPASPLKSKKDIDRPCRKAKELRRERKIQKLLQKGIPLNEAVSSVQKKPREPKAVENFLNDPFPTEPVYKLELRLVPSSIPNPHFIQTFEESFSLYTKYQTTIHKDTPERCTENQFIRFLVKNPFQRSEDGRSSETGSYGSFHHQYWLNGKLIAVGVLDILTYCVSSVYFYYDPEYSFLSLGTYAALREIALTRELNKRFPNIKYYYMGFYIHSCVKMKYKGQYHPSYLLCPETYIFQPIEKCKPKLDRSKYHRLEEDPTKEDVDGVVNLQEVLVLYRDRTMRQDKKLSYLSYKKIKKQADDEEQVKEYAGFVGRKCYRSMLLFRS